MKTRGRDVSIAFDVMGGDNAPVEPIHAAARISKETSIKLQLFGPEDVIRAELDRVDHRPAQIDIRAASEVVRMDEKPRQAISQKKDSSLLRAVQSTGAGEADAFISAGSTGALVLASALHIPRIEGVKRAALAAVYPTQDRSFSNDRFSLILDVGATVRCRPEDLLFFAYMGHAYASRISKVRNPSIGLLNVGTEETKGDEILTEAYQLLAKDPTLNFIGNVEGTDIPKGLADVIVCEGFVGNVVLKMAEGMTDVLMSLGKWAFKKSLMWKLGLLLLSGGIKQLKEVTDYSEYGGAPFLGFKKMVIKAHGRSGRTALTNAIKVAAKAARDGVCEEIERSVQRFHDPKAAP